MKESEIMFLVDKAKSLANSNTCCRHSGHTVGAVLVTKNNKLYTGFNVENSGIMSICAERTAFVKALSEHEKDFKCIVVVGKDLTNKDFIKTLPCGYCRQFLSEYTTDDFLIYSYDDLERKLYTYTLAELLPEMYSSKGKYEE